MLGSECRNRWNKGTDRDMKHLRESVTPFILFHRQTTNIPCVRRVGAPFSHFSNWPRCSSYACFQQWLTCFIIKTGKRGDRWGGFLFCCFAVALSSSIRQHVVLVGVQCIICRTDDMNVVGTKRLCQGLRPKKE